MRGTLMVLVLLIFVAALAVRGSQATPLATTNPILRVCQQADPAAPETARCRPVSLLATPAELERDFAADIGALAGDAGGTDADPEWAPVVRAVWDVVWRAAVAAASVDFVQRAMDWVFGDEHPTSMPLLEYATPSIFDPAR